MCQVDEIIETRVRICDDALCHVQTNKRTFGIGSSDWHMRGGQTDVRICDWVVSHEKRTEGRTVSDGKSTDGYRSLLFPTKLSSAFLSAIWVTDY